MRLTALFKVIDSEAYQNPDFAEKIAPALGEALPEKHRSRVATNRKDQPITIPDVLGALQEKGEDEFQFWLRDLNFLIPIAIVKQNGFDPAKASQRWKDTDKFIDLVHEQTQARLKRGSAFLPPKSDNPSTD